MDKLLIFRTPALMLMGLCFINCQTLHSKKEINVGQEFSSHVDMRGETMLERCRNHIADAKDLRIKLTNSSSQPMMASLTLYNDILVHVDRAMSQAGLLSQVHPDEAIRKHALLCEQEVSQFVTDLSLDKAVYAVLSRDSGANLTTDDQRMLEHTLRDFRRAGVDKDDETLEKIKALKAELVTLGQEFGENIREDRFVVEIDIHQLAGMPADYLENHQQNPQGKIEISTDYPDYIPFMQYAEDEDARKLLRHKYLNRGQKNKAVLKSMIDKRYELANLLGYKSYADYVVEDKMIKKADAVHSFIDKISTLAQPGADREYQALLSYKQKQNPKAQAVLGHESAYLEQLYKKDHFSFDAQSVRPYFSYPRVRDGLLLVTKTLFGIRYEPVADALVWDDSVETYDVFDDQGKLGRIYLDMHPRAGKYKHAAQFTVVSGLADRQYPEGALVCNFPNPKDGPALMEHDQVVTMFHEFGHLLHHLFAGRQTWIPFSGVATEWDFVEAPSQFLEEWAWSPKVLSLFARHYQTGETIPTDLVAKMRAADEFGKALHARQQMFYAALSVNYFGKDPQSFDPLEELKKLQAHYSYFPYEEGTHFHYSFGHLDGYSAMYYTYMWSLSLAKDLFEPFRTTDIMNLDQARRFKDKILAPGGSNDAAVLVENFLGRPFKFDAFERWLTREDIVFSRN